MTRRSFVVAAVAIAAIVSLSSGAYAYWTAHGSGSATATTGGTPATVHVIAVVAGNNPSSTLVPGGSADLVLEFNNPNAYSVTIVGIAKNGNVSVSGGTGPGTACVGGTSDNTGVGVTSGVLSVSVVSGATVPVHVSGGATMTLASASGCQGATFQIPVTVTVQR